MIKSCLLVLALLVSGPGTAETIAISYFDNTTGNSKYNALSKGIADMLITDLSKIRGIAIVEREKLEKLLQEIKLGQSKYFDPATAQKLGKGLGAQFILTGSFYILENTLRIDARLIQVENGTIILAEQVTGTQSDFFSLHRQLATALTKQIKVNYEKNDFNESPQPIGLSAVVAYSAALDLRDQGFAYFAQNKLTELVQQVPQFAFASDKLREIRAWLKAQDELLEQRQKAELEAMIGRLNPKSPDFARQLDFIWRGLDDKRWYTQLLAFNEWVRTLKLKPDLRIASSQVLEESLLYYDGSALYSLRRYEEFLAQSQAIIVKYPESSMTRQIKFLLENSLAELEKREKGKVNIDYLLAQPVAEVYASYLPSRPADFINEMEYRYYLAIFTKNILEADPRAIGEPTPGGSIGLISKLFDLALFFHDIPSAQRMIEKCRSLPDDRAQEDDIERLAEKLQNFQQALDDEKSKLDEMKQLGERGSFQEINGRLSFLQYPFIKIYIPQGLQDALYTRYLSLYPKKESSTRLFSAWKNYVLLTATQKSMADAHDLWEKMKQAFALRADGATFQESITALGGDLKKIEKKYSEYVQKKETFNPEKEILRKQLVILRQHRQWGQQIEGIQKMLADFGIEGDEKMDYLEDLFYAYDAVGRFQDARNIVLQLQTSYPSHATTIELTEDAKDLPY